jgi:hypothetical protein
MLSTNESNQQLSDLFRRQGIVDLRTLFSVLETHSRMTVFRRLSAMGYFSSYSHAGRYYTLRDVPQFDADGLWHYQGVGFSRFGSLKSTVEHMVVEADAGRTHNELHLRLQVRVHNTLLDLVRKQRIGREPFAGQYLYVNPDAKIAALQVARRGRQEAVLAAAPLPPSIVIEVLVNLIQGATVHADPNLIAARLATRGISVSPQQVDAVFSKYGVKKTPPSRSRRSRR